MKIEQDGVMMAPQRGEVLVLGPKQPDGSRAKKKIPLRDNVNNGIVRMTMVNGERVYTLEPQALADGWAFLDVAEDPAAHDERQIAVLEARLAGLRQRQEEEAAAAAKAAKAKASKPAAKPKTDPLSEVFGGG